MISIDAVRAAVLSDQPWSRLDDLVRAEMAAGRKVKEIADELIPMADAVSDTPGLSEDGYDAFGDTLDALTGNCRSDQCYLDPPNTSLPTEEEIAKLPRWARVAFAARCARRVLPLYQHYWPAAPDTHLRALVYAVQAVEGLVAAYRPIDEVHDAVASGAAYASQVAITLRHAFDSASRYGAAVAEADRVAATDSAAAAECAWAAAHPIANITPAIRRDLDLLARLAQWQRWTDDTPVPPEVFGPLWPEGPPPGWPADPDTPQRTELPLAFVTREGTSPRFVEDELVNLFNALNRYYILRTGDRLTVDGDIHTLLAVLNPAGVS